MIDLRGTGFGQNAGGKESQLSTISVVARYCEDLQAILKVLVGKEKTDLLSLGQEVYLTRLTFFYLDHGFESLLVSPIEPEQKQALFKVLDYLENYYGIAVKKVPDNICKRFNSIVCKFFHAFMQDIHSNNNNNNNDFKVCDYFSVTFEWIKCLFRRSNYISPILFLTTLQRLNRFIKWLPSKNIQAEIEELKDELSNLLDNAVLITVTQPSAPPYHYQAYTKPFNFVYAAIFSILGLPVTVVPVGLDQEGLPLSIQV